MRWNEAGLGAGMPRMAVTLFWNFAIFGLLRARYIGGLGLA